MDGHWLLIVKQILSEFMHEENKIFSQMLPWMLRETNQERKDITWQILSFISAAAPIKEMSEFIIKKK